MNARQLNSPKPQPQSYVHTQATLSTLWTVNHNLGRRPAGVRVVDLAGASVVGEVIDVDENTLQIKFTSVLMGVALVD